MINNVPRPDISPSFTIEDIHRLREWNYERLKDATVDERLADNKRRAASANARIEALRQTRKNV